MTGLGDPRLPERFWSKVRLAESGCWEWAGSKVNGYGGISFDGRTKKAHRVSYETLVGAVPDGLFLDHLCRNRGCVNPTHLEVVTGRENVLRGNSPAAIHARRTHCKYGHEKTPVNTMVPGGWRRCVECIRANQKKRNRETSAARRQLKEALVLLRARDAEIAQLKRLLHEALPHVPMDEDDFRQLRDAISGAVSE